MQRNSRAWLLLVFMGVLWGVTFSLAKMSTEGGAHPIGINYWCCLIGAAILISGSFIFGRPLPLRKDVLIICTVCGILGSVIPGTVYFYAAARLSPGVLSITIATVPLMTFLAAAALGVERISTTRLLGVFLGICGYGDRIFCPWWCSQFRLDILSTTGGCGHYGADCMALGYGPPDYLISFGINQYTRNRHSASDRRHDLDETPHFHMDTVHYCIFASFGISAIGSSRCIANDGSTGRYQIHYA